MNQAKQLTANTLIQDRDILRFDWEGQPRFYLVRIYPCEPRKGQKRVQIRVELEGGNPHDFALNYCDDEADAINEVTIGCISEIESLLDSKWEAEAIGELDDRRRIERRSYYR